ncbi:MAG: penicillin acylase family protein [Actinomycetota bacterium]|nr:penicillin acylase family protein [Actinomycetota bacterium]
MRKSGKGLTVAVAALPVAAAIAWFSRRSSRRLNGELELEGLGSRVKIDFDQWGVPHIGADAVEDAFFAQGFVTAQDRMLQMETFRRLCGGRMAEVIGRRAIKLDMFMRDLGIHRVSRKIVDNLPADTRCYLESFSAGVNAFLDKAGWMLPPELMLMARGRPQHWSPVNCIEVELLFAWNFDATWMADLMRGRMIRKLGKHEAERLLPRNGPTNVPVVEYEEKSGEPSTIDPPPDCEIEFFGYDQDHPPWMLDKIAVKIQGSNNWVVGGGGTRNGKPLLCNDPHAQQTIPTLFYLCHIKAENPACDMIGASLPGIPGIIMGRNSHISWGATSLGSDAVDVYIETFENNDSHRYLAGDDWKEADVVEEVIGVLTGRKIRHEVLVTRHGPVIARNGNKGLALKWVGHEPDNDSTGCFVRMGMTGDWEDFTRCLEGYSGPGINLVFADSKGNIGYYAAARIPIREGHDGSVPLPGESDEYEWKGFVPIREMPHVLNPERGWIATANNQVVGDGCPHNITTMWESSCRQGRIAELLDSKDGLDVDDMRRIQSDIRTCHGGFFRRKVLEAVEGKDDLPPRTLEAVDILRTWDARAEEDSAAQSIYFLTWRVLTERLLRHRLGHDLYFRYVTSFFNVNQAVARLLEEGRDEWLPAYAADYGQLLLQCLEEALVRLEARFGTRIISKWVWGRMHSLEISHFMGAFWPLGRLFNLGPIPRGGDGETVCLAMPGSEPTVQLLSRSAMGGECGLSFLPLFADDRSYAGPVFRMIVDMGDPDASVWCLDAGQCAYRASRYYDNFFRLWRDNGYVPMAFTPHKVEEATISGLKLIPFNSSSTVAFSEYQVDGRFSA